MSASTPIRMAIAGIHIESSTFSPQLTCQADFLATRDEEMLGRYPFLTELEFADIQPVPLAHFRAIPGGPVRRDCYEAMKREILDRIAQAGKIDAFYFDIHGAMAVESLADAEADLLAAIREKVGREIPFTCSSDLHGNITPALVEGIDLITTYRTAPHVDWMETRERAVRLLLRWWREPGAIYRTRIGIPVLVSGEMSGDNPTAGGAGDVPETLEALIANPVLAGFSTVTAIFASIPDAVAIAECCRAGKGAKVYLRLGGKLDPDHGHELAFGGRVITLSNHDSVAGWQAVVKAGGVHMIVTERPKPFHKREDFLTLDLDPLLHKITVVKIGYLEPELKAMARHHFLVLSAGAVPPLIAAISYCNLTRPMFPLDNCFDWQPSAQQFQSQFPNHL